MAPVEYNVSYKYKLFLYYTHPLKSRFVSSYQCVVCKITSCGRSDLVNFMVCVPFLMDPSMFFIYIHLYHYLITGSPSNNFLNWGDIL